MIDKPVGIEKNLTGDILMARLRYRYKIMGIVTYGYLFVIYVFLKTFCTSGKRTNHELT